MLVLVCAFLPLGVPEPLGTGSELGSLLAMESLPAIVDATSTTTPTAYDFTCAVPTAEELPLALWPQTQQLVLAVLAWLTTTWQGTLALLVIIYAFVQAPGPRRLVAFRSTLAAHLKAILGLAVGTSLMVTLFPSVTFPDSFHHEVQVSVGPFLLACAASAVASGLVAGVCIAWLFTKHGPARSSAPKIPVNQRVRHVRLPQESR